MTKNTKAAAYNGYLTSGTIEMNGDTFKYFIKHFKEGSDYGINCGKISILTLERNGKYACIFDRGFWSEAPADKNTEMAIEALVKEFG